MHTTAPGAACRLIIAIVAAGTVAAACSSSASTSGSGSTGAAATGSAAPGPSTSSGTDGSSSTAGSPGNPDTAAFCKVYSDTEQERIHSIGHVQKAVPVYEKLAAAAPADIKPTIEVVIDGLRHARGEIIPHFHTVFSAQQKVAKYTLQHCT